MSVKYKWLKPVKTEYKTQLPHEQVSEINFKNLLHNDWEFFGDLVPHSARYEAKSMAPGKVLNVEWLEMTESPLWLDLEQTK